jgi:hypothetical protein
MRKQKPKTAPVAAAPLARLHLGAVFWDVNQLAVSHETGTAEQRAVSHHLRQESLPTHSQPDDSKPDSLTPAR